jgi:redox-sensitive bicupin YhaK (pirin superfamily)
MLYAGVFGPGRTAEHPLAPGRHAWVHVVSGKVRVNGTELSTGDAAGLASESLVRIESLDASELLVFDLG